MKTLILMTTLLLGVMTTTAQAQHPWFGYGGFGGADTAQSAGLRGLGQALHGQADRLRAAGEFRERNQRAYSDYLDNTDKRIRLRWAIKDDYKARNVRPSYLDRMEARLDMAERRAALKQREQDLIDKGILPAKPKPGFTRNGIRYDSYADFKLSPGYDEMIAERDARIAQRKAEEAAKEARYQESIVFLRMWSKMGAMARLDYSRLSPETKAQRLAEFKNPELKWQRLKDDSNRRFYQTRPYLVPRAGQNGLPPLPSDWEK
jgi:hypothetical protein